MVLVAFPGFRDGGIVFLDRVVEAKNKAALCVC
jgi:hypothetical protein